MANLMQTAMNLVMRVMGDSAQYREDMAQDRMIMEDFLNSIGDAEVNIDLKKDTAEAELKKFKAELDSIDEKAAKIKLHDGGAQKKVEDFRAELASLRNEVVAIKLHDGEAEGKIADFKTKWATLKDKAVDLKLHDGHASFKLDAFQTRLANMKDGIAKIEIHSADAKAEIDDVKLKLDTLHDKSVEIDVHGAGALAEIGELDLALDGLERRMHHVNRTPIRPGGGVAGAAANAGRGGGKGLAALLAALAPLIAPLGASGGLLAGQTFASGVAGGSGLLGFFAVAMTDAKKVSNAMSQIQTLQQQIAQDQAAVKQAKTWQQWLVATEKLHADQAKLKTLEDSFGPDIMNAVAALTQFEKKWSAWTASFDSGVFKAFETTLQIIEKLMKDMSPVINAASKAINKLLKEWDKDLNSSGAAKYFKLLSSTTGPAILAWGQAFTNIVKGFAGIFEAFAPTLGGFNKGLVNATGSFAKWGEGLKNSKSFKEFVKYAKENLPLVLSVINQLLKLIGNILVAIAPLGTAMLTAVDAILKGVNAIFPLLKKGIKMALGIFTPLLASPKAIREVMKPLPKQLRDLWTKIHDDGVRIFGNLGKYLHGQTKHLLAQLKTVGTDIGNYFRHLVTDAENWGANIIDGIGRGIENAIGNLETHVKGALGKVESFLGLGHGNSVPVPSSASGQLGGSRVTTHVSTTVNVNAPVYGVNDLHHEIKKGVHKGLSQLAAAAKTKSRAVGVSG